MISIIKNLEAEHVGPTDDVRLAMIKDYDFRSYALPVLQKLSSYIDCPLPWCADFYPLYGVLSRPIINRRNFSTFGPHGSRDTSSEPSQI